jgi:hypothetical protein
MIQNKNIFQYGLFSILTVILLVNVGLLYKIFRTEEAKLELMKIDIKIKKEAHLGNLLFQYHQDLQDCFNSIGEVPNLTEEKCIKEMNQSELAKKIKEWGGAEYLEKLYEDKSK